MENLLEINERRTAVRNEKKVSGLKKVRKDGNVIDGNKRRITRMSGKSAWVEEVYEENGTVSYLKETRIKEMRSN